MLTDPISDYLTRVRNAIAAQHAEVEVPEGAEGDRASGEAGREEQTEKEASEE